MRCTCKQHIINVTLSGRGPPSRAWGHMRRAHQLQYCPRQLRLALQRTICSGPEYTTDYQLFSIRSLDQNPYPARRWLPMLASSSFLLAARLALPSAMAATIFALCSSSCAFTSSVNMHTL